MYQKGQGNTDKSSTQGLLKMQNVTNFAPIDPNTKQEIHKYVVSNYYSCVSCAGADLNVSTTEFACSGQE